MHKIVFGDNLEILKTIPSGSVRLIYIDPPFNTGKTQSRKQLKTTRDAAGDRIGFKGQIYRTTVLGQKSYADAFDDYLGFLEPRLREAYRILTDDGSIYFHIDYREVHYCKILLDGIFGRENFLNEIIWAYDYGARSKKKWPTKHDNILWYAKSADNYIFNYKDVDRIPYMAPGLVGPEKAALGKTPTDTWWHTIVSPNGKEKTGYPTQKPKGILSRIVRASSNPGDLLMDFFAGSGSFGEVALELDRKFILIDNNREAINVMKKRFAGNKMVSFATDKNSLLSLKPIVLLKQATLL